MMFMRSASKNRVAGLTLLLHRQQSVALRAKGTGMESFDEIVAFARVVEAKSFAAAAQTLGVTPSAMSKAISRLEQRLGAKLLHRTTRSLNLTDAGRAFYARCVDLMKRLEEAECEIACMLGRPAGRLRVGMPIGLSRTIVTPALPRFLEQYPELQVQVVTNDRIVDLIEEGIDVVLRIGELPDSSLQARKVGMLDIVTIAAPAFLAKHGVPRTPDDIDPDHCLGLLNMNTGQMRVWEFEKDGRQRRIEPTSRLSFNDSESLMVAAIDGAGYARSLRPIADRAVAAGVVQEVLPDWHQGSRPVSAVYARDRNPLAKVKVFVDFAAELFAPAKRPALKVVASADAPQGPARRATGASPASQPAPSAL